MRSTIQVPIVARKVVASGVVEVTLGMVGVSFLFKPGQYVSITLPGLEHEFITNKFHDFSIVSSPKDNEGLKIIFRNSGSVFKSTFMELPLGSMVTVEGPKGGMVLPDDKNKAPLVFIAGGVGVAPFLSMLSFSLRKKLPHRIDLFYINDDLSNVAYQVELMSWAEKSKGGFKCHIVQRQDVERFFSSQNIGLGAIWYLAGSESMVREVTGCLHKLGIKNNSIRTEEFTGYD